MKQKQLRSCVIEVRSLGSRRILVARGVARAPATGTGRMVIRIRIKPKGTKLLTKNFGGVIVNVRALCRSTSGATHVGVKSVRAILWIEHALTPPGSWVPDQPILTDIGLRFVQRLRSHMRFAQADQVRGLHGHLAAQPGLPADAVAEQGEPGLLGAEARRPAAPRHASSLSRTASPIRSRPTATEAGRRVNRRVFVTVVHFRVLRG